MASRPDNVSLYATLASLPDHLTGELIDGQLHATPRPAPEHALVSSALGGELHSPFQRGRGGPGGWWLLDEPEVHFVTHQEVTVPDLASWRRERLPSMPSSAFFTLIPDWICEIASPSTARFDRHTKLPLYEKHGVPYVWLIDPMARWLEVHVLEAGSYSMAGRLQGDAPIQQVPFSDVAIDPPWLELRQ